MSFRLWWRLWALIALVTPLLSCITTGSTSPYRNSLPVIELLPSTLGQPLAQQQHLTFTRQGVQREFDALLEVDSKQLRLVVQAMGQSAVRLSWDGENLVEQRAPWLPPQVSGRAVLRDLQFALWPLPALAAALPKGWRISQEGLERHLIDPEENVLLIVQWNSDRSDISLQNVSQDYLLRIRAVNLPKLDPVSRPSPQPKTQP